MEVSRAMRSSRSMKSMLGDHLLRNGLPRRIAYDVHTRKTRNPKDVSSTWKQQSQVGSVLSTMKHFVRGKLSNLRHSDGIEKMFRQIFSVREGEIFIKAFRCNLSTTAGPIVGRIFISTEKIAFCSDRAVAKFSSPTGEMQRFHYKVVIPLSKIKRAHQSENVKRPSQKYIQLVTKDEFEFWFMGFLNYRKTLDCVHKAVIDASMSPSAF